eukprot:scaffold107562_cov45-Phaeocystis_antarctica.AAC.1
MALLTMARLTMSYSLTTHLAHEERSALGHDGEVELVQGWVELRRAGVRVRVEEGWGQGSSRGPCPRGWWRVGVRVRAEVLARVVGGDDEKGVQVGDDLVRVGVRVRVRVRRSAGWRRPGEKR